MLRDLLSSRSIQVGFVFFVLVVGSSLLYSWHVRRTTVAEFARTDVVLHKTRSEQNTVDTSTVDFEHAEMPLEVDNSQMSEDTDVSPIDETSEVLDMADAFLPNDFVSEEEPAEDVPVSPFGYGAYPEVPEGFPFPVSWQWSEEKKLEFGHDHMRNQEVIDRVLIKLWNQGDREFYGAIGNNKKVYPLYRNTVYIEWTEMELPDGTTHRHISGFCGPDNFPNLTLVQRMEGAVPAGFHVLDMHEDAIHVSEFLNISK